MIKLLLLKKTIRQKLQRKLQDWENMTKEQNSTANIWFSKKIQRSFIEVGKETIMKHPPLKTLRSSQSRYGLKKKNSMKDHSG